MKMINFRQINICLQIFAVVFVHLWRSTVTWIDLNLFCQNQFLSSFLFLKDFSLNNLSFFLFCFFFFAFFCFCFFFSILFSFASKDIKVTNKNIAITSTEVAPFTRTAKYWQGKFGISFNLGANLNTLSDSAVTQVTFGILMALLC